MKTILYWIIAIIITLSAAVYQRLTGPTHPKRESFEHAEIMYKIKFPRSHESTGNCPVVLKVDNKEIRGKIKYKKFPSNDEWTHIEFEHKEGKMVAELPVQPPAGKLLYQVELKDKNNNVLLNSGDVVIRYKGAVPDWVLIPHIFFMFFAMLLSTLAGLLALGKKSSFKLYTKLTLLLLLIGGMILGPVVQKYAFGELWTGVPFGWDLTDNKTLIGFVAWIVAVAANWKRERPVYSIIAAILLLIIYSVPHSMFGSELDYSSGVIGQG
ncbi:hypothetical protein ACFLQ9_00545 [Bacteroidota bacterium]